VRGIKAKESNNVGIYNFVATSPIYQQIPSPAYEPFVVPEEEDESKLRFGDIDSDEQKGFEKTVTKSDPFPLVTKHVERYELGSKNEKLKYQRKEYPFFPDYETVRKSSDEAHIPYRPFTLGYIPQTLETEKYIAEPSNETGNGQPLKAVIVGSLFNPGEVTNIKVLTAFGLHDNLYKGSDRNPFSWLAIGIPANDPLASSTNELEEMQWNYPWFLSAIRMYLNFYPNFIIQECKDNVLSQLVKNDVVEKAEKFFPLLREYTDVLKRELFSKKADNWIQNDWFASGQPQLTIDALTIVEKSIKKFHLSSLSK